MDELQPYGILALGGAFLTAGTLAVIPSAAGVSAYVTRPDKENTERRRYFITQSIYLSIAVALLLMGTATVWHTRAKIYNVKM